MPHAEHYVRRTRVLLAEDNKASLRMVARFLERQGYEVVAASDGEVARSLIEQRTPREFDCVLTDVWMPVMTGLELLSWLNQLRDAPAVIIMSARADKGNLEDLLRNGAFDFLDKPFSWNRLRGCVARAVNATAQRRSHVAIESEVLEVARTQRQMLHQGLGPEVDVVHRPKHLAGGDCVIRVEMDSGRYLILVTDVSGHDLNAAFTSAYFQGVVRGMLVHSTPVENVLGFFNRLLLSGDTRLESKLPGEVSVSVSACAIVVDPATQSAFVYRCGSTLPVYSDGAGCVRTIGFGRSHPLGWFEDSIAAAETVSVAAGGAIYVWTDGLEDLAWDLEVNPLALVYRLSAEDQAGAEYWLGQAADDVLLMRLSLVPGTAANSSFQPLLVNQYSPAEAGAIDRLQADWERSLRFAVPKLPADLLKDILLCSREAVLNALLHGCREDQRARISVAIHPDSAIVRVRVEDPGPGHSFSLAQRRAMPPAFDRQRGLLLMQALAGEFRMEHSGAHVVMDFYSQKCD